MVLVLTLIYFIIIIIIVVVVFWGEFFWCGFELGSSKNLISDFGNLFQIQEILSLI
jgi:hypothetical protein